VEGLHNLVQKMPPVSPTPALDPAVYTFNILSMAGTGIFLAAVISGLLMGYSPWGLIKAYGRTVNLIGPPGSGQLTKMVNQICIGALIQALAEGLHFAERSNLDIEKVIATISKGAAQSWQMENRWKTMVDGKFDFGFAVDWVRKDFALVFDEARKNGAELPVTALVDQFYAEVQAMGGNRWDTSSLIALLQRNKKS